MRYFPLVIVFLAWNPSSFASSSLGEELAAERGVKQVKLDLLGKSKSAPIKTEIMGCGGQPLVSKMLVSAQSKNDHDKGSADMTRMQSVESMKAELVETSRKASSIRYQSTLSEAAKKKSCNVNFAD